MDHHHIDKSVNTLERIYLSKHVVVHPIVLLSVVDHYNRISSNVRKRALGTVLGEKIDGVLHITNSYALPFEEDVKDVNIFYIDDNYNENMFHMIRKINTREKIVGWYTTGSNIRPNDIFINELFYKYIETPIFLLVNVHTSTSGFPVNAYVAVEKATHDEKFRKTFVHIPVTIGAFEAEEVGVEYLLKELTSVSTSTLANRVGDKLSSLRSLISKLSELSNYLGEVANKKIKLNNKIMYNLQNIFTLLPDVEDTELIEAFMVKNNDMMLNIYIGSITRTVIALHNLISNKIENKMLAEKKKSLELEEKKNEKKENEQENIEDNDKQENAKDGDKREELKIDEAKKDITKKK